jgi:hypothetical protein
MKTEEILKKLLRAINIMINEEKISFLKGDDLEDVWSEETKKKILLNSKKLLELKDGSFDYILYNDKKEKMFILLIKFHFCDDAIVFLPYEFE